PGEVISSTTTLFIYDGVPGCEDEEQVTITITPQPDIDDIADPTVCASFTLPNITGTNLSGSEAYFTQTGGQGTPFNPGEVISSTTTLFIYDGVPGCEDEEQVTITITPQPDIDDIADQTVCTNFTLPIITGANLSGNEAYFTQSGGQGTRLLPGEIISATTTLFIYDGSPGCEDEEEFTVAIAGQPSLDPIDDVSICGSFTLPEITGSSLSGNQAYFTESNGAGTRFVAGEPITTTTTLFAFDGAAGCEDEISFTITILDGPDITPLDEQFACSDFQLPAINGSNLTGNEAYFTSSGGNGTRFEVGEVINTSQTLFIYDGTTGCEDEEAFSLTINPLPQIDDIPDQVVCGSFTLPIITGMNLSGEEAYFDEVNGNGNRFEAGDVITSDQVLFLWDNSNGCNSQQVFEIIVNEAPDVLLLPTLISCAGENDGQIATSILAGSAPFTYDWNFDQFDGEDTLRDVGPGIYSLVFSDASNCAITATVTLTEPIATSLTCQENSPVSDLGGNDGIADIDLMGGVAPYELTWDNGNSTGSESIATEGTVQLSDLNAGNYSVLVIDNNGCEASCNFTITDPACSLNVTANATDATCHDSNDGSILVDITGGQAPFTFSWNDPNLDGIQSPTGLAAGDYMLSVTDANGCEVISSASVAAPQELSLTGLSARPVSGSGQNDGGVSVNYQGGTPPYQISWTGGLFGSLAAPNSGVFSLDIFPEGDYTLRLTDANGCQTTLDFTIPGVNCDLSITLQGEDLTCFEDQSGRIQLNITGGVSPLDIDWNLDTLDGLRAPQDLAAGDYEVIVTDANGCTATQTVSLQQPTPLSVVCALAEEASSPGASDGEINIEVSGGEPNYTIDWTNGMISGSDNLSSPGTATISGLPAGNYEVFVIDNNSCMETCTVEVTEACPTSENTIASTLCAGDSIIVNGNIYNAVNPSGQEILSGANTLGCDSIVNIDLQFLTEARASIDRELCLGERLTIGTTEFNVDNPSGIAILPNASPDGCDSIITVNLTFLAAPVFSLEGNSTVCPGEPATLTFRASNFIDPVNIIVSDGAGNLLPVTDLTDGATFEVNPQVTSTYSIMDTDVNGGLCPPVLDGEVTVIVTDLIVDLMASDYNGFQLSCADAADGQIEVVIQGGSSPFTYAWSNGSSTESLENLPEGLYELTVTDATGCEAISEILLSAPALIEAELTAVPPGCNEAAGLIRIESISGGTGPFSLSLDGNAAQNITSIPFELSPLSPGSYEFVLTDANGCSFMNSVVISNEESLLLDLGEDITIGLGETAIINPITNFTIDKSIWEPNDSIVSLGNNEFSVSPTYTTVYTLTATDAAGCSVSDQITVIVDRSVDLFQPTAFSPNNDGVNDVFQVFAGPSIARINSFIVFDRWGSTVYEGYDAAPNDPSLAWDGTYRGQPLNSGVYVYYVEVTFVDGRTEVFKGDVALVR
ncbi:MAG: gliding motility-associated C-terminal domain-containing protein, partial [Saprospiraceae bacterium]|nr:gliding motility-associated C-terminal domain-containing protein [Saprospiraceae bacterium]